MELFLQTLVILAIGWAPLFLVETPPPVEYLVGFSEAMTLVWLTLLFNWVYDRLARSRKLRYLSEKDKWRMRG